MDFAVPVYENTPVYPGAPDGFDWVMTWGYDGLLNAGPADSFETHGTQFYSPALLPVDLIQSTLEQIRQKFAEGGQELLAYGVYKRTALQVTVPDRLCIGDQCIDVPTQFCIPFTSVCIGGAGSTLATVYEYWVWFVTRDVLVGSGLMRPAFPVLGVLAIGLVIVVIGVMLAWWKGSITFDQFKSFFSSVTPGGQIKEAESGAALMFAIVGAGMVATAIMVPRLISSASLGVDAGPVKTGVTLGTAGAPASTGRRR